MKCKKITKSERIRMLEQLCEEMRCKISNLQDDNFDNKRELRIIEDVVRDLSYKQSIHVIILVLLFGLIFSLAAIVLQS